MSESDKRAYNQPRNRVDALTHNRATVPIFRGQSCHCLRHADGTTQVVDREGRVLGAIVWHARWRKYSFVPQAQTAWDSTSLTEIALWLRRLTRDGAP